MNENKNYLDYVPVKANHIVDYIDNDDVILEFYHKGFFSWLASKLYHVPRKTKYKLDYYGSKVWNCMDGKNTIDEIAFEMKSEFGGEIEPLYERLTMFIRKLEMEGMLFCREPEQ